MGSAYPSFVPVAEFVKYVCAPSSSTLESASIPSFTGTFNAFIAGREKSACSMKFERDRAATFCFPTVAARSTASSIGTPCRRRSLKAFPCSEVDSIITDMGTVAAIAAGPSARAGAVIAMFAREYGRERATPSAIFPGMLVGAAYGRSFASAASTIAFATPLCCSSGRSDARSVSAKVGSAIGPRCSRSFRIFISDASPPYLNASGRSCVNPCSIASNSDHSGSAGFSNLS